MQNTEIFSQDTESFFMWCTGLVFEKVGTDRSKVSNGRGVQGSSPGNSQKKIHYGLCNHSYSGALLVNTISLVFLQSMKVILTLLFMPTILFTNIDADLCNSSEADLVLVFPG